MSDIILIVDDDRGVRYSLKRMFEEKGIQAVTARNGREALELLKQEPLPNLILMDIVMPGISGLDLLEAIKHENPQQQVIMMTAHGTTDRAIRAMKLGAFDYIQKPFDIPKMWETVQKALQTAKAIQNPVSYHTGKPEHWEGESIVGNSPQMQEVYKIIGQIAGKEVNVLITGESGTGKELVARAIYHHSLRNHRPFLSINCAAIPENLLESELFGHEKGAFTGAEHKRIGRFEQAHTGMIFLDEIGDMPIHIQAKILRFIQEGEIQRLGSSETIKSDVRLIAATNKSLEAGVKEGWFREDLYYRLNVVTIQLPSLRERREDIPDLIRYFISRFRIDLQKEVAAVQPDAMTILMHYHWPGNVRELENSIKRAIVICKGNEILPEHLPAQMISAKVADQRVAEELLDEMETLLNRLFEKINETVRENPGLEVMSIIEKGMIERAIRLTSGNKLQAASLLGINRNTLRNKMERYGIRDTSLPEE